MFNFLKGYGKAVSKEAKASLAYTVCSILQRAISYLTLPIFARLLSTEEYGLQTVYQSTMALLLIFTSLQLPYGSFSPAMMRYEADRDGYVSAIIGLCTLLSGVFLSLYLPFRSFWNRWLNLPDSLIILMVFEMLAATVTTLWMGRLRFEYRYKPIVALSLLSAVFSSLIPLAAVLMSAHKGLARIFAHSFVVILTGLILSLHCFAKGRKFFDRAYWKYALGFNIPLVPYYLSQMIFNQSDRLMIDRFEGRSAAAQYGVAYSLAVVLNFVLNSINNSFIPWEYGNIKSGEPEKTKPVANAIAFLMAFLLLGIIALAPEIILVMAGEKYVPAIWVVPPVAMSLLFLFYTQLFGNVEFYHEEKMYLVLASLLSAITNVALNAVYIPKYGFVAAAYTTLFSFILFALCNYGMMKRTCQKHGMSANMYDYKTLILLALAFMSFGFVLMALYRYRLPRFTLIALVLAVLFVARRKVMALLQKYLGAFR